MDKLEEILKQLAEVGVSFEVQEKNLYQLTYDEIKMELFKKDHELYLKTRLAPCPKEKKEALFSLLMKANQLGSGTYGNAIGLDNQEKFLTLTCQLPYDIIYKDLKEKIELFLGCLHFWQEEIKNFSQKPAVGTNG
ncbi:MAG: type III secretion system chaperone [Parachlamydiales bacterium]|jgi:hypothetical protein